jgi:hypothetical protein
MFSERPDGLLGVAGLLGRTPGRPAGSSAALGFARLLRSLLGLRV